MTSVAAAFFSAASTSSSGTSSSSPAAPPGAPPTIRINGANPAVIHVGDSYQDLGATITGPTDADKNLGLKYFLSGKLVSDIVVDTTKVATDTIDYVATDPNRLAATSTRLVLIEAFAPPPSLVAASSTPAATASSTRAMAATSSAQ